MDILTVVQAVLRRWYVSVPIFAVAAVAAVLVQLSTPPQFQASGQVLLADPELDPSTLPIAVVDLDEMLRQLDEPELREELASGDASYQVSAETRSSLAVTVVADDENSARSTALAIDDWLGRYVDDLQADSDLPETEQLQVRGGDRIRIASDDAGDVEVSSTIELFDPTTAAGNPFAASMATARLLIVAVQSDAGRAAVRERTGPGVSFVLAQTPGDPAPIVDITTTGSDPETVLDAFETVRRTVDEELADRQDRAEIPSVRHTRVETLAQPRAVTDISPPVQRTTAAILGLGFLLAVSAAVTLDSISTRRRPPAAPGAPEQDRPVAGPGPLAEDDDPKRPGSEHGGTGRSFAPQASPADAGRGEVGRG
jgi:hypothetical protein